MTVPIATLDALFTDSDLDSCALWIDVEGGLRGGTNVLRKASVVIIEVEDRELRESSWLMTDVASYLYDLDLVPAARDFEYRYQYNIVFARRTLLNHDEFRLRLAEYRSAIGAARRGG